MAELKDGVNTRRFEYTDKDGLPQAIMLRPLNPGDLPKLFKAANTFKGLTKEEGESNMEFASKMLDMMDESTVTTLADLCLAVIKKSSPEASEQDINDFVSSQFLQLFPLVIQHNLKGGKLD